MVKISNIDTIRFDGGKLCLNYINTIYNRFNEPWEDYLQSLDDLFQWAHRAGILNSDRVKSLKKNIQSRVFEGSEILAEAIYLREVLYKLFTCIARDETIPEDNLTEFNDIISNYFSHLKVSLMGNSYIEEWNYPEDSYFLVTAPILKDAYDLVLFADHSRIRECLNCGWIFFDSSKNGTRRWCSMSTCGSNVKALNWYHKQKTMK